MATSTRTLYGIFGRKADGTWERFLPIKDMEELAEIALKEYIEQCETSPANHTIYEEYKIMQCTQTVITGDWEEI